MVLEFLELPELFLNCKWFLKNPWNKEFLRICSGNVLKFYFSSFIKKLYPSFSGFIFLKLMSLYRFQILFYDAKTFVIFFLLIFVFHEICRWLLWDLPFLKKPSDQLWWYFQRLLCSWKVLICSWMFLNCSWIFIAKVTDCLGKITKTWISQEQEEFLRLIKKHFLWFLKDYHLVRKEKFDKK